MKNKGFTLIELIVVITILAILGTIAFIGFKGYTSDARDSKVTTDIANLHNSLTILKASKGVVPMPDSTKIVTAGITKITYEGEVGSNVRNVLKASSDMKTPTGDNYKYAVSEGQKDFTLVGLLENETANLGATAFADSNADIKYFKGGDILTLFDVNNNFIEDDILILANGGTSAYLGEKELTKTGSKILLNSCEDIKKAGFGTSNGVYKIALNGVEKDTYCDMQNDGGGWTLLITTDKNSVAFGNNDKAVSEWHKSGLLGTLPTSEAEVYTDVDYKSDAYSQLKTDKIRLCLADGSHCYTFNHNKGISLFDFFDKDISYKDAGYNNEPTYKYNLNANRFYTYEQAFGDFDMSLRNQAGGTGYECKYLGINMKPSGDVFNGAIGLLMDRNSPGPCGSINGESSRYDDLTLGIGLNSCLDNSYNEALGSICASGGSTAISGINRVMDGTARKTIINGPWVVWGK